jgi:hypothetical protein
VKNDDAFVTGVEARLGCILRQAGKGFDPVGEEARMCLRQHHRSRPGLARNQPHLLQPPQGLAHRVAPGSKSGAKLLFGGKPRADRIPALFEFFGQDIANFCIERHALSASGLLVRHAMILSGGSLWGLTPATLRAPNRQIKRNIARAKP